MNTPTILKKIIDTKAQEVASRSKALPLAELKARALDMDPAALRGFYRAMQAKVDAGLPAVIAEIKKPRRPKACCASILCRRILRNPMNRAVPPVCRY